MKTRSTGLVAVTVIFLSVFLTACPKRVSIQEIESDPGRFSDKEVAVAGTVKDSYGVSVPLTGESGGIYKIDDGTGSIWVFTRRSVPGKNAQLGVKGKIRDGFVWGGKNYGLVLIEEDRKFKKD